jgi:hypothetical protein
VSQGTNAMNKTEASKLISNYFLVECNWKPNVWNPVSYIVHGFINDLLIDFWGIEGQRYSNKLQKRKGLTSLEVNEFLRKFGYKDDTIAISKLRRLHKKYIRCMPNKRYRKADYLQIKILQVTNNIGRHATER